MYGPHNPPHRPRSDPDMTPAQSCLVNFERYRALVEALRAGLGPSRHLERSVYIYDICIYLYAHMYMCVCLLCAPLYIRRVGLERGSKPSK